MTEAVSLSVSLSRFLVLLCVAFSEQLLVYPRRSALQRSINNIRAFLHQGAVRKPSQVCILVHHVSLSSSRMSCRHTDIGLLTLVARSSGVIRPFSAEI